MNLTQKDLIEYENFQRKFISMSPDLKNKINMISINKEVEDKINYSPEYFHDETNF